MPYESKAQQRAMHAKAERGEIDKDVVKEYDEATKKQKGGFDALPEKKKDKDKKKKDDKKKEKTSSYAGVAAALSYRKNFFNF